MPPPRGSAIEGVCTRPGYIILESETGRMGAYQTICKSWSCLSCQKKLLSLFIERARLGYLTLGPLYFITITWRWTEFSLTEDAISVEKDWRAWLTKLRRIYPGAEYLKVIELTKRKQPHFHLIMGGLGGHQRSNCRNPGRKCNSKQLLGPCKAREVCYEHKLSRMWHEVTGDSYFVCVRDVYSIKGLCNYLSKYMVKSFDEFEAAKELGFGKRWTQSFHWPKLEKMQLRGTKDKSWKRAIPVRKDEQGVTLAHYLLDRTPDDGAFERLGTDLAKEMALHRVYRAQIQLARKVLNG